jgi:hypothetical protein
MKNGILSVFAATLVMAGLATAVRADDRAEINALYARLEEALKTKTPEATLALETPDFTEKSANGKSISGKQLVEQMKQQYASIKDVKDVKITVKKATITGKTARVTTELNYTVLVEDKEGHMGSKGGTHEMAMDGEVKNDLVKTAAGWKFKTTQRGVGKMFIDGNPISSQPAGTKPKKKR